MSEQAVLLVYLQSEKLGFCDLSISGCDHSCTKYFLALVLGHCCGGPQGIMSLQQFFHVEMRCIYMDVQIFRMLSHFSSFEESEDDDDLQVLILFCWGVYLFE